MSLLKVAIIRDVIASRPTDNSTLTEGRLFFASDTGAGYRDSGSGWDQVLAPATSSLTVDPTVLPAANGGSSYTLPSVVTHPTSSVYYVRRQKWMYTVDYTIKTSGGVSTLNIVNTAQAPQTGDKHELYAV